MEAHNGPGGFKAFLQIRSKVYHFSYHGTSLRISPKEVALKVLPVTHPWKRIPPHPIEEFP